MTDIILDEYRHSAGAVSSPIPVCAADVVPREQVSACHNQPDQSKHSFADNLQKQPPNLGPQRVNDQEVTTTVGEPINTPDWPIPDIHPDLESAGSAVPDQEMVDDEQVAHGALLRRSKLTILGAAVLLVAVLALIVTPGVVLGLLMQQAMMGIALSGAITTVIGTFAGFYYFHSKKG